MIKVFEAKTKTQASWRLFCSHGTVLFYIARHPECTIRDIADALALTPRTVWGLIGDLRRAGLLSVSRKGRRHHYTINGDGRFPDPIISHLTLGEALEAIASGRLPASRPPLLDSRKVSPLVTPSKLPSIATRHHELSSPSSLEHRGVKLRLEDR